MRQRIALVRVLTVVIAVVLIGRMAFIDIAWGPELAARAEQQRTRVFEDHAKRGEIVDRQGKKLAFTMRSSMLSVHPNLLRDELPYVIKMDLIKEGKWGSIAVKDRDSVLEGLVDTYLRNYATEIASIITENAASHHDVSAKEIYQTLTSDSTYSVLVARVDPDIAQMVADKFFGIVVENKFLREYPNGAIASNVLGKVSPQGAGQFGFEASRDFLLAGRDGQYTYDVSNGGPVIPGTRRDKTLPVDGGSVTLTLDLDLQTYVQQQLEQAKANSLAQSASAVVLDAHTGEVLAMANTDAVDNTGDLQKQLDEGKNFGNPTISEPFEPGSVAKIITAAGVIEDGVSTPDEVLTVPGSIHMAGVSVKDAWDHGPVPYTTTGIFGKSSNVGTLMLAQRLGEQRYGDLLKKFGIGHPTGIELPAESEGLLPPIEQWSGGTFANLPIGQGMSWTLLQMAGVYQTLANGGERIEPRIIAEARDTSGTVIEQPEPRRVRVVSKETAQTVVDMFRSVTQSDPSGLQQGTGSTAAIAGYQIAGKTGTAQQVDPLTQAYSNSAYWITFAGIAPADDPRFVVALMLDRPQRGVHGEGGQSAAPLFHDIASWLLDRDNIPLSPPDSGPMILQVP
ncbi:MULTISPECIES: penicillin-binding protein 2 [unclassified Corynebacterium]|uniref:peptidoglycan D,D-transpeptidase FtsI family protein n=1 Tax=unclassified Corynebacterium TaxID=2624378 RepID=UPI002166C8D9|nr:MULTISPECIES: penicillin-binding protein 2 [unclassified Corynebacterium]MCS4489009.1 penicillin-binding protein 2 [Corynebacterium sp. ES2775-CONJ]MCS4490822.1 penicillin-binding protein 2 [Corynebacterium sp. ES2715-CONJ3]MCS4531295.1 penicillin-binding protein 2 [Corynebacterium sp. ES2730-CONJ]